MGFSPSHEAADWAHKARPVAVSGPAPLAGVPPLASRSRPLHRLLGLSADERDPVTIIVAAQIRLRRWRRYAEGGPRRAAAIVRARDAMLERAFARLSRVSR